MLYYQGYTVSFQEVPDEVSLVILVADCPHRCPGCHSPELQKAEGKDLEHDLESLISKYYGAVTCVCLMGEGRDKEAIIRCAETINNHDLKSAVYSGSDRPDMMDLMKHFDYVKYGSYQEDKGGLDSPTTNQRMLHISRPEPPCEHVTDFMVIEDITPRFRKTYL